MLVTGCSPFIRKRMKKVFLLTVVGLSLLTVVGCSSKKEMKEMKGVVTQIWTVDDSLVSTRVAVGSDTLEFQLADARFINGMFINGDSVNVNYIEEDDDVLHAYVISVLPKPVRTVDLNGDAESDTLITRQPTIDGQVQPSE